MNSIQETSDYDTNMKLPRFMSNYKYKQAKYLLNLTQNKYRKRKPFHFIDSTLYKTHWNYSSYYNDNETNENYTPTYRPYNYYYYYNYNNNSSHSRSAYSNIYGKRSDYGRFKRSKDSGPSLADVPMNVEFNTANPTYASNRFHVFSYEQVKQLDAIMNSCICIAPKPLFSSCIDENNPVSMNKACSCCYLQQSLMNSVKNADDLDISGLTITPLSNLSQNKKTSGEMTDTTIDATTSETPSTTPTKNTPSISSNNNLKTSTFSDHLLNEENFITHSSNSPDLSSTCYHDASVNLPSSYTPLMPGIFPTTRLPTIRIQLKKLIRTIRDRLVEESIPVKEIRLGGGAACSIVGSQKTEKFNDIDLIFRVDLSNSSTFTKIKSIVFSCITHILADTIALEKLKHYSYGCTYMCNNTLPLPPIHSPQTTPQNSLPPCCCNCTCSTLNKSFQLNKENLGSLQTTHDAPKGNNNHKNKHKHNNNNNSNSVMIESSGNRQPLHENQSNGVYQSNVITEENSCEPGTCSQNEKNSLSSSENQTEGCNYTYCSVCHPYYAYDSFLPPVACSMCSRQFSCSYYNNIDCVINNNNNNKSGNNSTSIMNPYNATIVKQYIQKMIRIFKPNSKISDSWSLFTLGYRSLSKDNETMIIDMKFIDRMHRQFEFTVDSFQIVLDSLIKFHDPTNGYLQHQKMNENFYPTVVAESLSGSYVEAVAHLNEHIIATYRPEEIHGGGLLKYCRLLAEDYKQSETTDVMSMEKYMCSRFFIDFPDIISQHNQINAFLLNQFERDSKKKANYLNVSVVEIFLTLTIYNDNLFREIKYFVWLYLEVKGEESSCNSYYCLSLGHYHDK
ncbi:unnamed protein product [Trichobilharzia regenti]|nr:unnamed protein product [Trichobilharzia regenti]